MREYKNQLDITDEYGDLMTIEDWNDAVKSGCFNCFDGIGFWVKDGYESEDEVFYSPQYDATHVAWYNK